MQNPKRCGSDLPPKHVDYLVLSNPLFKYGYEPQGLLPFKI